MNCREKDSSSYSFQILSSALKQHVRKPIAFESQKKDINSIYSSQAKSS
jgi:hypothetical protein